MKDAFFFETEPIKKVSSLFSSSIYLLVNLGNKFRMVVKDNFSLENGTMPAIGYGCWNLEKTIAGNCVKQAIR